jgi:HAD superfamily hydrolase (TIGR01549 family)
MQIKAILFDFDGTLVHSIDHLVEIFQKILAEKDLPPVTDKKIRNLIGEPLEKIFCAITPLTEISELSDLCKKFHEIEETLNTSAEIDIVRETISTLKFIKSKNLKLGIVSTKRKEVVLQLACEYQMDSFFDVLVGGEDVIHYKPHPEPIFHACEKLCIKPSEILFVGDSLLDLKSAKSAGAIFVGVLTGVCDATELKNAKADYIFSHVGELVRLLNLENVSK